MSLLQGSILSADIFKLSPVTRVLLKMPVFLSLNLPLILLLPIPTFLFTALSSFSVPLLLPLNFSTPSPTNFSTPQLTYPITTTFLSTPNLPVISLALLPRLLIL